MSCTDSEVDGAVASAAQHRNVQRQQAIVCSHTVGRGARPRGCSSHRFPGFAHCRGHQISSVPAVFCITALPPDSSCCRGSRAEPGVLGGGRGSVCFCPSACYGSATDARSALGVRVGEGGGGMLGCVAEAVGCVYICLRPGNGCLEAESCQLRLFGCVSAGC